MSETRSRFTWVLAGGAAMVLGALLLLSALRSEEKTAGAVASDSAPREAVPLASAAALVSRAPPLPAAPSAAAAASSPPGSAECRSDDDCVGARTADCVRATCRAGRCEFDRGACGCTTSLDCDDGDPCTRNHCFLRTFECVFIPQDC